MNFNALIRTKFELKIKKPAKSLQYNRIWLIIISI